MNDKHSRAEKSRELAQHARHLASLMHQPGAKQELLAQAAALEHEARTLESAESFTAPAASN